MKKTVNVSPPIWQGKTASLKHVKNTVLESTKSIRNTIRNFSWHLWITPAIAILAAVTAVSTLVGRVLNGSAMQYSDYWNIFSSSINPDGSFAEKSLLLLQNEHPVAAARVLYFLNYKLFDGSNQTLGVVVILLAFSQAAILYHLFAATFQSKRERYIFLAVTTALLFTPQGLHNFQLSMSGAAWISANVFSLAAFAFALRGKAAISTILGLAASASYGTGLMVWPALAVLLVVTGTWKQKRWLVTAAGALLSYGIYLSMYERPMHHSTVEKDLSGLISRGLSVLGSIVGTSAAIATLFAALMLGAVTWFLHDKKLEEYRPAVVPLAVLTYSFAASLLIGLSRDGMGTEIGTASRYASISALFIIGFVGIMFFVVSTRVWVGVAIATAFIASSSGQSIRNHLDTVQFQATEGAIAAHLGYGHGYVAYNQHDTPLLRSLGHYPFVEDFTLTCGKYKEKISANSLTLIADTSLEGKIEKFEKQVTADLLRISGHVSSYENVECLLIIDQTNTVVGAASTKHQRPDLSQYGRGNTTGFIAVADNDATNLRAVLIQKNRNILLEGTLEKPEVL